MATDRSNMDTLPEECVCKILSYTSPPDACRFSMVSSTLRSAADSDVLWRTFLPSDYHDIISRTLNPLTLLQSSSYKHLFCSLCRPLLLDRGNMVCTMYSLCLRFNLLPYVCFQQYLIYEFLFYILCICRSSNWTSLQVKNLISYLQGSCP